MCVGWPGGQIGPCEWRGVDVQLQDGCAEPVSPGAFLRYGFPAPCWFPLETFFHSLLFLCSSLLLPFLSFFL